MNGPLGRSGFLAAFSLIFLSEIGDKTFFIAALLAAKLGKWISFAGSVSSLSLMTIISVTIGAVFSRVRAWGWIAWGRVRGGCGGMQPGRVQVDGRLSAKQGQACGLSPSRAASVLWHGHASAPAAPSRARTPGRLFLTIFFDLPTGSSRGKLKEAPLSCSKDLGCPLRGPMRASSTAPCRCLMR